MDRIGLWKPIVGGLAVGLIGRFFPDVFGSGSAAIESATWGRFAPLLLLLLLLVPMKMLATSLTLASGGSGGVFGPSMYIGRDGGWESAAQATVVASERLDSVMARLSESDTNALVVVDEKGAKTPVGIVRPQDLMRVYERAFQTR